MGARRDRRKRQRRRRALAALALLVLVATLALAVQQGLIVVPEREPLAPPAEGTLRVHYLDVGQGDAVVWELPGGGLVLYDCGPPADDAGTNPVVRYLTDVLARPPGSRIHALVSSHGHLDHVGGCEEVLAVYDVAHVYETWYEGGDRPASYDRFLRGVQAEPGVAVHTLQKEPLLGGVVLLPPEATAAGVRAEILWPTAFVGDTWDQIAESSVVVRLVHGEVAFCFQGDIETAQELAIAQRAPPDACDAYLVGHHGSRHASSAAWLARMDPEVAVVSFGENPYGHPTSDALCRVQQAGATVYATHRAGDVVLSSDGVRLAVGRGGPESLDYCRASYWSR